MSTEETTSLLPSLRNESVNSSCLDQQVITTFKRRWYILCVFSLLTFVQGAAWSTWGTIAEASEQAMGWTDSDIALLTNWGTFSFIVSAAFFAWLMDVKGLRWAAVSAASLVLGGTMLRCITMQQPLATWLIRAGQILIGLAGPVVVSMPTLLSATWFPVHERIVSTAVGYSMNGIGVAASFLIGPLVVSSVSNSSNSDNRSTILLSPDIQRTQHDILLLMYIECSLIAAAALAICVYFPAKPPRAPSITASLTRINFTDGFKHIIKNKGFWMLGGAFAISTGVNSCWSALLDVNLKSIGISQTTSGYIAFTGILCGNISEVFIAIFSRKFTRRYKLFVIILYTFGSVAFLLFTLQCAGYIPYHQVSLFILMALGSVCLMAAVPFLYELLCEVAYPAAEGVTNTLANWMNAVVGAIFLLVLMIPTESKMWMNWTNVISLIICIPVFTAYKEQYNRLDVDTLHSSDDVSSPVLT